METSKGKRLLIISATICVVLSVGTMAITALLWFIRGYADIAISNLTSGSIRLILTCLMFYYIFIGSEVARTIATILLGVTILFGTYSAVAVDGSLFMLAFIVPYIFALIALRSKHVKAYMAYKRTGNTERNMEKIKEENLEEAQKPDALLPNGGAADVE